MVTGKRDYEGSDGLPIIFRYCRYHLINEKDREVYPLEHIVSRHRGDTACYDMKYAYTDTASNNTQQT